MLILSSQWVFIVLGVVGLHWLLPEKWRNWWIVAASAAFLGFYSPLSLFILTGLTGLLHYAAGRKDSISGKELTFLIICIGALLSLFKLKLSLYSAPIDLSPATQKYIIPLGLSYYTFRCIHYAIEKYRGTIPAHGFSDSMQYLFFLPTFTAGPIHRFHEFQRDLRRKRWDFQQFTSGLERILLGYFKITFLGNLLVSRYLTLYIQDIQNESLHAYVTMIRDTLNLYFQFSGYSDIAIGFGMLLGIKVMENFNFPFLARNISDFWRRWHISLTSWCRDYVYMGTVAVSRAPALAAVAAMLVMGLWHEFSIRYIVWGIFHGAGIMIWQKFQDIKPHLPQSQNKAVLKLWRVFATLLTLHYFMLGVVLVHNGDLPTALQQWKLILLFWI